MSKASVYFVADHINGKHAVKEIKREISALPGVLSVSVNDETDTVAVDFDTTGIQQEKLQKHMEELGYKIADTRLENHMM